MYVYFVRRKPRGRVKIGSTTNPKQRIEALQTSTDVPLALLALCRGRAQEEREFHQKFQHLRRSGEWFQPDAKMLAFIKSIADAADPELLGIMRSIPTRRPPLPPKTRAALGHARAHKGPDVIEAVPLRRQLREAVERAREEAKKRGERLTWQAIAEGAGITSAGAMRKMLQGEAPMDDATANRIAAVVEREVALVKAEKKGRKK